MELEPTARRLDALGHPVRLMVYRMLVQAGKQGLPVARLQSAFGMPASSFSHHLKRLVEAGLMRQVRSGTKLICHAEAAPMDELIAYLSAECVQGDEGTK